MATKHQTIEEAFVAWLSRRVPPSRFSHLWPCYIEIDTFCRSRGILKQHLFETADLGVVKQVQKTVLQNKLFKNTHKKQLKNMITAAKLYTAFHKERAENLVSKTIETSNGVSNTVTGSGSGSDLQLYSTKGDKNVNGIVEESRLQKHTLSVDFQSEPILSNTRPVRITYFQEAIPCGSSWTKAYIKLFSVIYDDYSHKLAGISDFCKSGRPDLCDKTHVKEMLGPKPIADNLFLETNLSVKQMVQRIKALLDICCVDYENVVIEYELRQNLVSGKSDEEQKNKADLGFI